MTINTKQFLQTFIDESNEMLQEMEKDLLEIKQGKMDQDKINRIFRVAHSIKSSSNIFNFKIMSSLSHTLENYLDEIRNKIRELNKEEIEYLFYYVDCLRAMLFNIENNLPLDEEKAKQLKEFFQQSHHEPKVDLLPDTSLTEKNIKENVFKITYWPHKQCFLQGEEPFRILNALAELGEITVKLDASELPSFLTLDPTQCYLKWDITLSGQVEKKDIEEVLAWGLEDSDKKIVEMIVENNDKNVATFAVNIDEVKNVSAKSIRVATNKIDNLMNIAGEFVILQSMFNQMNDHISQNQILIEAIDKLEQHSLKLQDALLRIRMIPIEFAFTRFPRMVNDLSQQMGKAIELIISGEKTELDRSIIEKIIDPLSHLIRNAIDHGIEIPDVRKKLGKPAIGHITINTYQESNCVIVDITDDGGGIDLEKIQNQAIKQGLKQQSDKIDNEEIIKILAQPGFSTASSITEISGRGVGMDVVSKNLSEMGGKLSVKTEIGKGTTFKMRLPLTLAIMDCQLIKVNNEIYVIPLISFSEILKIDINHLFILDKIEYYKLRENYVKIVKLNQFLSNNTNHISLENKYLLIVEDENKKFAFCCDEILWQQQVVIKNIEENYQRIDGITGATILGDGRPALVLDTHAIAYFRQSEKISLKNLQDASLPTPSPQELPLESQFLDILSFLIAGCEYGVNMNKVKEILICSHITPLPNVPAYVKGIINLRGLIIPVIDILECFSLGKTFVDKKEYPLITLNIPVGNTIKTIAILVDFVSDTYHVSVHDIHNILDDDQFELKNDIQGLIRVSDKDIPILNIDHSIFR